MAMQQCPNGHLYDDSKNSSCPYCSNNSIDVTVPLTDAAGPVSGGIPPTMNLDATSPNHNNHQEKKTIPETVAVGPQFEATKFVNVAEDGFSEVKGWLICVKGSKRGMDFKIHGEKNTIGRGAENDIKLDFDPAISKGVNAIIAYDSRNNKFYLYQSNSKNNIYFNNQLLLTPVELRDYDVLEIGETKMIFRSLCNEEFSWNDTDMQN